MAQSNKMALVERLDQFKFEWKSYVHSYKQWNDQFYFHRARRNCCITEVNQSDYLELLQPILAANAFAEHDLTIRDRWLHWDTCHQKYRNFVGHSIRTGLQRRQTQHRQRRHRWNHAGFRSRIWLDRRRVKKLACHLVHASNNPTALKTRHYFTLRTSLVRWQ
jgi:hypothetical protein